MSDANYEKVYISGEVEVMRICTKSRRKCLVANWIELTYNQVEGCIANHHNNFELALIKEHTPGS